jgi:hypothetical protein
MAFSLPIQVGGGPTRFDRAFDVLESLVGVNGYAVNEDEIESLWRQAKAEAMAALETFDERAAYQISPETATDHIPLFEEMLGIKPPAGASDEERRQEIVPDYTGAAEAWGSALTAQLQRIDPAIVLRTRAWENCSTTIIGRWYQQFAPTSEQTYDAGGNRKGTNFPNVSDSHSVIVEYPIPNGSAPSKTQRRKIDRVRKALNDVCPAWVDFHIIHATGFILDTSLLDATSFGS